MGLATSQVRMLSLTSRKADVEMQMQLNSKRKTMLTREATQLSKLYYAKLQSSKIQYATANGYSDVNYDYLMAEDSDKFFEQIVNGDSFDKKQSSKMIVTDTYGRVVLSHKMLDVVVNSLNANIIKKANDNTYLPTVKDFTLDAMKYLLEKYPTSGTAIGMKKQFELVYNESTVGRDILMFMLENGYQSGGKLYKNNNDYYSDINMTPESRVIPKDGVFYTCTNAGTNANGSMYWGGNFIVDLDAVVAKQLCKMFEYYGTMLSASFNGTGKTVPDQNGVSSSIYNFNVAAKLDKDAYGMYTSYGDTDNKVYDSTKNNEYFQDGLKSGLFQILNVSSVLTGGIERSQGLNYFKVKNAIVEKVDTESREALTAWYNAERADISEKESYWDSEITTLSAELNTITTEIDSVKKLRDDAISSTFKWGSA